MFFVFIYICLYILHTKAGEIDIRGELATHRGSECVREGQTEREKGRAKRRETERGREGENNIP